MVEPTREFVILRHDAPSGLHWDLCLDLGEALATWQLPADPADLGPAGLPARRIADHRRAYLDYEGPVSGSRGSVRRSERGTWRSLEQAPDRWRFELCGARLSGLFELRGEGGDAWTLHRRTV